MWEVELDGELADDPAPTGEVPPTPRAETALDARRREGRELHTLLAASSRLALAAPVEAAATLTTDDAAPGPSTDVQATSTQSEGDHRVHQVWCRRVLNRLTNV